MKGPVEPRRSPARRAGSTDSPARPARPTREQLQAAYGRTVPDLVGPGVRVVLVGINPSLESGAVGYHFASPSNRLWPTLELSGFTPRRLHPSETEAILACGIGVTNLVDRATARADELTREELRAGVAKVEQLAHQWRPAWLAFLGISSYRVAFGEPRAVVGRQERRLAEVPVWVLPNPSGLNASYQLPRLAQEYGALREVAFTSEKGCATD